MIKAKSRALSRWNDPTQNLFSVHEAAYITGKHYKTLKLRIHNNQLQAEKPGHDWIITRAAIAKILAEAPKKR